MGKATQDLRKEHEAILYVLQILDKMIDSKRRDAEIVLRYYGEVIYFLKIFADKCHHGKEENYLFKELVNKGIANEDGPVGVMLQEHAQGRDYIAHILSSACTDMDCSQRCVMVSHNAGHGAIDASLALREGSPHCFSCQGAVGIGRCVLPPHCPPEKTCEWITLFESFLFF